MISFIDQLIDSIHSDVSSESLIIVPTRRAALQIERKLGKIKNTVGFLPLCIPIADLMLFCQKQPIANDARLIVDLFSVYKKVDPTIELDEFIKWGDQIISDFDEIDRNLIDTKKLFKRIVDVKEIDEMFSNDEYETEILNRFWKEFSMTPLSKLKYEFLSYWEALPVVYSEFNELLEKNNYCYEGKAWKNTAISIDQNEWFLKFDKIVFAGFYALTKSEEKIIAYLKKIGKAIIIKDADIYYSENKKQEAGNYFRKGVMSESQNFTGNFLSETKKEIRVVKSNGTTAMAKDIAIEIILQFELKPTSELSKAVVVLPDDSLLIPLLQVLEKKKIPYNPSMGIALANFPILTFIKKIKSIRTQLSNNETNIESIVSSLFQLHSFNSLFEIRHQTIEDLKKSLLVPTSNYHFEHKFVIELLNQLAKPKIHYQQQLLNCLRNEIIQFGHLLSSFEYELSINAYWTLLLNHLNGIRLPIEANEGEGININGFLETRLTDYDYVFISNLNEGTLPSNATSKSLIPYALRKFYSLPCKEEQDAVTAYHFYRLLQRSSHISFFYNNEMTATGGGEKSRFLFQIEHELIQTNKNILIKYCQYPVPVTPPKSQEIEIIKDEIITQKLITKYLNVDISQSDKGKGFSASSLASYIYCPLKYYFEQIANLQSPNIDLGIDQMTFGKILHKTMELIYENQNVITDSFIDQQIPHINHYVNTATVDQYSNKVLTGNDYLLQGVLNELSKRIIDIDKENTPIEIIGLEAKVLAQIEFEADVKILVKGVFDRVDIVKNQLRLLDYKTGGGEVEIPDDFTSIFVDSKYKIVFQLFLYNYILSKAEQSTIDLARIQNLEVVSGAYLLKSNSKSISLLNEGKPLSSELLHEFEIHLKKMILDILDTTIPFKQTEDYDKCGYCDFKNICSR